MTQIIRTSTQEHLDIENIMQDLVVLKNGNVVLVLKTTSVNFDLLSEMEQDAMIAAFSSLLNSLSFPIQITIRSKRLDISNYIDKISVIESKIRDPLLRVQAESYRKFVQELIKRNEVLDKTFYVVISSGGASGNIAQIGTAFGFLHTLFGSKTKRISFDPLKTIKNTITDLYPKRDNLIREFARINIKAKQLNTQELVELFFDVYNPVSLHDQRIRTNVDDYQVPIVEPAMMEE